MGAAILQLRSNRWILAAMAIVISVVVIAGWREYSSTGSDMSLDQLRLANAANNWPLVRSGGQRYLRRHPADAEAIVLVAQAEAAEQGYDRALALLAKVPANSPYSPEARLKQGQVLRQLYRGAAAERAFRQAADQGLASSAPQRVIDAARLGLIQLFAIELRNDEARRLIWALYRASPEPVAVLELLGRLDIEGAEPHEASQELQKFIANDPGDFAACLGLAHHYMVLGRAGEARLLAERCLETQSDSLASWEALLGCLEDLGENRALAEAIERVPRTADESAWYWKYRGIAAEDMEQWEAAESAFRQAVQRDPFDSRLQYRLGRLLRHVGKDISEADEHIARARELTAIRTQLRDVYRLVVLSNQQGTALSDELCADMGEHYEFIGLQDGAAAWYQEALKRNPADAKSRQALDRLQAAIDKVTAP
jgi:tetratricopeptide (TPR) repeat protein